MSPLIRRLAPLLVLLLLAALAPGQDDEIVSEFQKYFRKFKDTPTRVEAIFSLEGADTPGVVEVLLPVLCDEEPEIVDAAVKVLGGLKARPAIDQVFLSLGEDKREAVRVGLLRAIAEGEYQGDGEMLVECLSDKAWDVRRRAVQALQARSEETAIPAILPLVDDREPAVRCAALESLGRLREPQVVDHAIASLEDKVWQVRASAALALELVRAKRSIGPLITAMEKEEGRLVDDYSRALEEITGKGMGARTDLWRQWWTGIEDRFEIPSDEALAKAKEQRAKNRAKYMPGGATSYHGIETPSRSILFIIDVSGSMENEVVEKERFKDGDYPSYSRIDIVKTELRRTIEGLEKYVKFNVLSFATEVDQWKDKLVPANVINKKSADDWVRKLEALGGNSKEDLAQAGLVGSANLEAGKTNTYGVLMKALEAAGRGKSDKYYEVAVDTIFFLSDGRPTVGELVDPHDILREVRKANELRKVVLHTIAIGEFQKEFMETLARENGGVFVDLGK